MILCCLPTCSYGFVVYTDPTVTDVACAGLHGMRMADRTLTVRRATEVKRGSWCGTVSYNLQSSCARTSALRLGSWAAGRLPSVRPGLEMAWCRLPVTPERWVSGPASSLQCQEKVVLLCWGSCVAASTCGPSMCPAASPAQLAASLVSQ